MTEQPTPKLLSILSMSEGIFSVQDDCNVPVWSHTSLQKAQTTQNRNITWQERAGMAILIAMALSGVWVIAWGVGL